MWDADELPTLCFLTPLYHGAKGVSSQETAPKRLITSTNVQRIGSCLVNSDENLEPI